MRKMVIVFLLVFVLAACQTGQNAAPINTEPPAVTLPPTVTPTATVEPTKEISAATLVPMYEIGNTSELTDDDLLPYLDIMTNAEQQLRDAGMGEEIDRISEDLINIANDYFQRSHTLEPMYALNPASPDPVYTFFLNDKTGDCLIYPVLASGNDPEDPNQIAVFLAHSGDVSELEPLKEQHPELIYSFRTLTVPAGIDTDDIRLVATKNGIVPGVFLQGIHVAWFDFERMEWHLTQLAKTFLENDFEILNAEENLEVNLTNWLTGITVIPEEDIFDQNSSQKVKFNIFDRNSNVNNSIFGVYYGVLLGQKEMDGNLYLFVGFEDSTSKRYYLPFNLGRLDDANCAILFSSISSNLGEFHYFLDQSTRYQCQNLRLVLRYYFNKPIKISQFISKWEDIPTAVIDPSRQVEYEAQQEYAYSMASFIYNSAFSPIGSNDFNGLINPAPDSVDVETYPLIFIGNIAAKK